MISFEIENKIMHMEIDKHMQIGIIDIALANKIYTFFKNYFVKKNSKDSDGEANIFIEGKPLSKSRFKFIGINSFQDIDDLIQIKKDSLISIYNDKFLDTIEIKNELLGLEKQYYAIVNLIERKYKLNEAFKLKYKNLSKDIFSMKNISFELDFVGDTFEKTKLIIYLLDELGSILSDKYLLYLNHVETYLSKSQVKEISYIVEKSNNIFMVIATSNSSYLNYKYLDRINFLIDNRVFSMPDIDLLSSKASKCMENIDEKIDAQEMYNFLERHSFELVTEDFINKNKDQKIFNAIINIEKNNEMNDNISMDSTIII